MFNNYFNSIVKELTIPIDQILLNDASTFDDLIIAAVRNYKKHQCTLKIKEKVKKYELFFIMLTPINVKNYPKY